MTWVLILLLSTPQSLEHEKKGVQLLLSGHLEEAQRELETCVRLDPNAASCHRHLGVIFAQRDDLTRSIHHYKVYVTLDPYAADAPKVRKIIADSTGEKLPEPPPRELGIVDEKIKTLAREVGEEGEASLGRGNVDRAKTLLLACIELNPASALCHRSLGVLYARADNSKLALEHYRRYVQLAPDAPDADRVRRMIADSEKRH
jgi:regulator of sirC expression with transglutaminase-like and TPR domain